MKMTISCTSWRTIRPCCIGLPQILAEIQKWTVPLIEKRHHVITSCKHLWHNIVNSCALSDQLCYYLPHTRGNGHAGPNKTTWDQPKRYRTAQILVKKQKKWHLLNDERKNCRKPRNNGACFVEEPDASSHPPCTTCSFQGVHRQHPAQNAVEV